MANIILPGTAQPSNVLTGETFSAGANFDTAGTMPNHTFAATGGSYTGVAGYRADGAGDLCIQPEPGYYTSETNANGFGEIMTSDTNFVPGNIAYGKSIFGVAGTYLGNVKVATGTATGASSTATFNYQDGTANTQYYVTITPPGGAQRILAVIAVASTESPSADNPYAYTYTVGVPDGYANGTESNVTCTMASLHNTSYIGLFNYENGGSLEISTSTIQLPIGGVGGASVWYMVLYL